MPAKKKTENPAPESAAPQAAPEAPQAPALDPNQLAALINSAAETARDQERRRVLSILAIENQHASGKDGSMACIRRITSHVVGGFVQNSDYAKVFGNVAVTFKPADESDADLIERVANS